MSVCRVAVTGLWFVFLQNTGLTAAAARAILRRADRGVAVPIPMTKLCSAQLNGLGKNTGLSFMWTPAPFLTYGVGCVRQIKLFISSLVQICYRKVSKCYFEQLWLFFFAVIALLDWVFLKQMRSSPFSNLYCLFCIDSSWNPAKEWRLKLFSKYYMYKSW